MTAHTPALPTCTTCGRSLVLVLTQRGYVPQCGCPLDGRQTPDRTPRAVDPLLIGPARVGGDEA